MANMRGSVGPDDRRPGAQQVSPTVTVAMTVTDPPKVVRSVYLRDPWKGALCNSKALCHSRYHLCVRCDVVNLWDLAKDTASADKVDRRSTEWMEQKERRLFCYLVVLDVVSLGSPVGACCYHGLGTAAIGCWARYLLRKQYHVTGMAWLDLVAMLCCPGCAVAQEHTQMLLQGGVAPPDPCAMR